MIRRAFEKVKPSKLARKASQAYKDSQAGKEGAAGPSQPTQSKPQAASPAAAAAASQQTTLGTDAPRGKPSHTKAGADRPALGKPLEGQQAGRTSAAEPPLHRGRQAVQQQPEQQRRPKQDRPSEAKPSRQETGHKKVKAPAAQARQPIGRSPLAAPRQISSAKEANSPALMQKHGKPQQDRQPQKLQQGPKAAGQGREPAADSGGGRAAAHAAVQKQRQRQQQQPPARKAGKRRLRDESNDDSADGAADEQPVAKVHTRNAATATGPDPPAAKRKRTDAGPDGSEHGEVQPGVKVEAGAHSAHKGVPVGSLPKEEQQEHPPISSHDTAKAEEDQADRAERDLKLRQEQVSASKKI